MLGEMFAECEACAGLAERMKAATQEVRGSTMGVVGWAVICGLVWWGSTTGVVGLRCAVGVVRLWCVSGCGGALVREWVWWGSAVVLVLCGVHARSQWLATHTGTLTCVFPHMTEVHAASSGIAHTPVL